jgi:purine-nucleoside phosphorylase
MIVFADHLTRVQLEEATEYLVQQCPFINAVDLVIQLGSGYLSAGLLDEEWSRFPLQSLPHMPTADSRAKHELQVHWGIIGPARVLVLGGRYHLYEGLGRLPCLLPIWAAAHAGARTFLLTNAAGAVNPALPVGSLMLLRDHINQLGTSALAGHQHLLQDAFVDMTQVYHPGLGAALEETAIRLGTPLYRGVYLANHGPQFETPAEVRLAATLGADAVGMSTVLEATLAHALGARVVGLTLLTNHAAGLGPDPVSHEAHRQAGHAAAPGISRLIKEWIAREALSFW